MPNNRNVAALTALLSDYVMSPEGHGTDLDNIELAAWLASHGVLVPSALRNEDVDQVSRRGPVDLRFELDSIARGEG